MDKLKISIKDDKINEQLNQDNFCQKCSKINKIKKRLDKAKREMIFENIGIVLIPMFIFVIFKINIDDKGIVIAFMIVVFLYILIKILLKRPLQIYGGDRNTDLFLNRKYKNLCIELKCPHKSFSSSLKDIALLQYDRFLSLEFEEIRNKIKKLRNADNDLYEKKKKDSKLLVDIKKISSILLLIIFLTSCSSNISKNWSCRNTESKLGCVSISEADDAYSKLDEEPKTESLSNTKSDKGSNSDKYSSFKDKRLIRTGDKVGRIWIAPYKDANDNYHEESYIQIVDETGKWEIIKKEIIVKDYKLDDEPLDSLKDYQEISLSEETE